MDPAAAVLLNGVFQAKRQTFSFLWYTRRFTLCADRTLRRYDGEQLRHSTAITSATVVSKVGDAEFTVSSPNPHIHYDYHFHIRATSSAERDSWVRALTDAITNWPLILFFDRFLGKSILIPAKHRGQVLLPCHLACAALCVTPCHLACAALCVHAHRSRHQPPSSPRYRYPPFPRYTRLRFPPLQLQRFLRGCVRFTAHALVTPTASVFRLVPARAKSRWIDRIVVRVMSGFVARAEQTQADIRADATARIAGKDGIGKAAERGDVAAVHDYLIADASCMNRPAMYSWTPLHVAVLYGRVDVVQLLLQCNAAVDAIDSAYSTPLHLAAYVGRVKIVKLLLLCNAAVDARDRDNSTPLHLAAKYDVYGVDVCRTLISAKADAAARDKDGDTPLKKAIAGPGGDKSGSRYSNKSIAFLRSVGAPEK